MLAGEGVLEIARGAAAGGAYADGSVILRAAARAPLKLLLPRNHGHAAWVFSSNLGGGFVDGDDVALRVHVRAGAAALLTTQASTKIYRSPAGCRQRLDAEVDDRALLVVLPDPVACFAGARFEQASRVRLGAGASLVLVDALTCGRAARGERWAFERYASAITVTRAVAPAAVAPAAAAAAAATTIVHDALELDARAGALAARLGRFDALATVVVMGPAAAALLAPRAPPAAAQAPPRGQSFISVSSPLPDGSAGALLRCAASSAEALHGGLRALLVDLPALLGDDPFARKW